MQRKVLFIDRDGTLIREPTDCQIDSFEKLIFYPHCIQNLAKIKSQLNFELVIVSNQDGMGTDQFPENTFWKIQNFITKVFANEGVVFSEQFYDRSFPEDNLNTRKPGTGMLTKFFSQEYDLKNSFVIGDRFTDIELAKNLGARAIYINNQTYLGTNEITGTQTELKSYIALETSSWQAIYQFLACKERKVELQRNTQETEVTLALNLDGTGHHEIKTGIGFFDHMLAQISRHAQIDLKIQVKGDLYVDEHHTIEDTAIVLGEAFAKALSDKLGIERYGFCLPMDDCLARVAIDFGGRSWLVWKAEFKREAIGRMPTEMFYHFFKSFADSAKANINIQAEGTNEHHKIEAIFKAFAKALKAAVRQDSEKQILPSTKGVL